MKAYRFRDTDTGLQLENIDTPKVSAGEGLIDVKAAGLCHSDCHILKGNNWVAKNPITLGHEVAGTIIALGDGVSNVQVGNRVAVAMITHPLEQMQLSATIGLGLDGGFAEFVAAPITHVVPIPDQVSYERAAVATDSISTAYHAIIAEAKVTASCTVAIVGLGGLGLNGLRIAALQGARVYGIDIDPGKRTASMKLGAIECFSSLKSIKDVTIDVAVDFVGLSTTLSDAIRAVKLGGRVVAVGLGEHGAERLISRLLRLTGDMLCFSQLRMARHVRKRPAR
jgi:propanol-preferring alcohol dehydrogenase